MIFLHKQGRAFKMNSCVAFALPTQSVDTEKESSCRTVEMFYFNVGTITRKLSDCQKTKVNDWKPFLVNDWKPFLVNDWKSVVVNDASFSGVQLENTSAKN